MSRNNRGCMKTTGQSENCINIAPPPKRVSEIRADAVIPCQTKGEDSNTIRVWGQVLNDCGEPIAYALLKLVKVISSHNGKEYIGIAHGLSDSNGFYQFDVPYCTGEEYYKIIISIMYTEEEVVAMPQYEPCKRRCEEHSEGKTYYRR